MKWIGALLFISATSWIGFDFSKQLTLRTKQLKEIIYAVQLIEAEMVFSYQPLREIFISVAKKLDEPLASFFLRLGEALTDPVADFISLWDNELTLYKRNSALKQNEIDILKQFGRNIGHHHIEQQQKQIKLTLFYLQQQLEEANSQKNLYEKTVRHLSVLLGILIVLILI